MELQEFLKNIETKNAKICVMGLGQVGLPTALTFAKTGFVVTGYDIDQGVLASLNSKKSPFEEHGLQNLLELCMNSNKFSTKSDLSDVVEQSEIIIICVPTPINNDIKPNLSFLKNAIESLMKLDLGGKLIIIESSIPPGTFDKLIIPHLNQKNTEKLWIVFAPERLSPGQALSEIETTSRIIGTIDVDSGILAKKLYENIVKSKIILTSAQIAEISKLVENTFRDVNVALANEVGLICDSYGMDVLEVLRVCNSHPRVNLLNPGPGVGGPCLPKDPYLLLNPSNKEPIKSPIIQQARKINDEMPLHVIDIAINSLLSLNLKPENSTVGLLGTAYKGNVSDTRYSPAIQIIKKLQEKGCNVIYYDPLTSENFNAKQMDDVWKLISASDAMIITTDHDQFKILDLEKIAKTMRHPILIDCKRIFDNKVAEKYGIIYKSIGYRGKNISTR